MNLKIKAFIATSILSLAATGAAYAGNAAAGTSASKQNAISYGDLDLSTQEGNRTLYERIRTASQKACAVSATGTRISVSDRRCVEDAVSKTVQSMHSPMLAEVHESFTHRGS